MDSRRTQILNDMGIETWCLRSTAAVAGRSRPKSGTPVRAKAGNAPSSRKAPPAPPKRQQPPAAQRTQAARHRPTDRSAGESFTVTAFCTAAEEGGALLACGSLEGRGEAALAADIVRCMCRNWSATVKRIEFRWPLPGVFGAPEPALAAFLDKQLQDFAVTHALATASAAAKVPPVDLDFITIPDLAQIDGPDAKRALWQQLQEPSAGEREGAPLAGREPSAGEREGAPLAGREPSAGEREGSAPRRKEPSAGEREGSAPRRKEPSAGEREGSAPRLKEPSAGEREAPAPPKATP